MSLIEFKNVSKEYKVGEKGFFALKNVNLTLEKEKFIVILGPSGAGKSTLLNLLGGLDSPTDGKIIFDGKDISELDEKKLAEYRAVSVGFVFQFYNLIPTLTVYENVALIKEISPNHLSFDEALDKVGLLDHKNKFPASLSGGEQQRVSIARALAKNPSVILCDEPTGALDSETGVTVLKVLYSMVKEHGKTVVIVTHNQNIAKMADVIVRVKNGNVDSAQNQSNPLSPDEVDW